MGIDIRIHIDLTPRQKRIMRWAVVTGTVIGALGIGIAIAGPPISTTWIANGSPVSATDLAGNLNGLQSQITAGRFVATNGTASYSVGATKYCGATTQLTPSLGGYLLAKAACQSACGASASAHVCSTDEVLRSYELLISVPQGWVKQGNPLGIGPEPQMQDCEGFQTAQASSYGAIWAPSGEEMSMQPCSTSNPALCCD